MNGGDAEEDEMITTENVFTWSTPAPLYDGTVPAPWRVAHRDAMEAALAERGLNHAAAYAEHDGAGLWVGLRDNRDPAQHSARVIALGDDLRAAGFRVRQVSRDGRVVGLRVCDHRRG